MIRPTSVGDGTGALLVRFGLVTASQLEAARQRVAQAGGTIGEALVVMNAVDDGTLTEFYRTRLLVPQVDANSLARISAKTLATVPADVAIELRLVPVTFDREGNLTVAMSDPSNGRAVDELGFFTSSYVVRNVATQAQIAWCLAKYYNHVTELATRQMVPVASASNPAITAPVAADLETKVAATRHRILAPVTAPIEVVRPRSDVLDQPSTPPRPRSASGEIKIVAAPAPTPVVDEPSGPIITIEPEPTEPLPIPVPVKKRKAQLPDPPELAARAGEVAVAHRHGQSGVMEAMPAVLIDLSALEAPVEPVQVDRSGEISRPFVEPPRNAIPPAVLVEVSDDIASVVTPIEDAASAPILLSPAMAKSHPGIVISSIEGEASEPIELIAKVRERARIARQTQLGFAPPPSSTNGRPDRDTEVNALTRDTEITTAVMFDEDGMPLSDDALVQVAPPGPATTPSVIVDETIVAAPVVFAPAVSAPVVMGAHDDDPNEHSIPTAIETPRDATLPFAIKMVPPAPITPALDPVDDGWGPPGTTIPPPFVGEAHDLDQTASVIPIPTQDSAPLPIAARESSGTPSMWRGSASADAARALEASTAETFRLLTVLDRAASRDEVIGALVEHLAKSHRDAAFCVVRNLDVAVFAKRPGMVPTPPPTLSLSEPSALQDAYSTRIPYRGVVPDARTGAFMQSIFSRIPSDLLLLPIIIRERTIGIWCGTERDRAAFDEQLALVARAAGTALERIVRSKSK